MSVKVKTQNNENKTRKYIAIFISAIVISLVVAIILVLIFAKPQRYKKYTFSYDNSLIDTSTSLDENGTLKYSSSSIDNRYRLDISISSSGDTHELGTIGGNDYIYHSKSDLFISFTVYDVSKDNKKDTHQVTYNLYLGNQEVFRTTDFDIDKSDHHLSYIKEGDIYLNSFTIYFSLGL